MIKIIKIEEDYNIRLDKYLKNIYSTLTQSFIEKNIRKKNILINDAKTSSQYIIKKNDNLKICNFSEDKYKNKIIFKKNINIPNYIFQLFKKSIVFQNLDFIILNKWALIATQGGSKINFSIDDIINKVSPEYKLVHRLDRETSGLLIIAKHTKSARFFGNLFKKKFIEKIYIAICEGRPKMNESNVELDIKNKMNKIENTKTYYRVMSYQNGISCILYKPLTGKTHQLRIVSKNLGCPIIGDYKYNHQSNFKKEILKLNAHSLKFTFDDKNYEFFSELPEDFVSFTKKYKLKLSFIKNYSKF